jgi:hypothetical protein
MARVEARPLAWQLEQALAEGLARSGWNVEVEPVIGTVRPDVLAVGPSGDALVAEIKTSREPLHFATIAQVAGFGSLARKLRGLDRVRTIVLALGPVGASARRAAEEAGVEVVAPEVTEAHGEADERDPREVAAAWVDVLIEGR